MDSMDWGDGIASRRTFGGCHSIHLSYGRDDTDFTRVSTRWGNRLDDAVGTGMFVFESNKVKGPRPVWKRALSLVRLTALLLPPQTGSAGLLADCLPA
jgi:hypothetical protein